MNSFFWQRLHLSGSALNTHRMFCRRELVVTPPKRYVSIYSPSARSPRLLIHLLRTCPVQSNSTKLLITLCGPNNCRIPWRPLWNKQRRNSRQSKWGWKVRLQAWTPATVIKPVLWTSCFVILTKCKQKKALIKFRWYEVRVAPKGVLSLWFWFFFFFVSFRWRGVAVCERRAYCIAAGKLLNKHITWKHCFANQ